MEPYVVDSNFFIESHRERFPLDIVTGFWNQVSRLAQEEKIISIDKVKDEIFENDDELTKWIKNNMPDTFFYGTTKDDRVIEEYRKVVTWAYSQSHHYKTKALDEFLEYDRADAWLVAYCSAKNLMLVTQEISNPYRKNKIQLPDACTPQGVQTLNMNELFRRLGVTF